MNPVVTLLTWPMISAENALKAAWAIYAAVIATAIAIGLWSLARLPMVAPVHADAWAAGALLAAFGAWRVRAIQHRLCIRRRVTPVWPFAVLAALGLATNAVCAVMLCIALFEVLQARTVLQLAPGVGDRQHS